jgi:N-methylhydantoinase A
VGPESAGADPGPACYGRGGTQPTVTDANLVLGRVDPEWFAGGTMKLLPELATEAVGELGQAFGLDTTAMAEGICDVANAKMAQAIRNITVDRGIEPRDFSLVAFGGAGPMHAAFIARELEIAEVVIPPSPGAFSAWGMLETELRRDLSQSFYGTLAGADQDEILNYFEAMEAEIRGALVEDGIPSSSIRVAFALDMRYVAQEYTLTVPIDGDAFPGSGTFAAAAAARFDAAHDARFGHANPGAPIEIVTLRVTAFGELERPAPTPLPAATDQDYPSESRRIVFGKQAYETPVIRRDVLKPGMVVEGPAVILEQTATTVLPPGTTTTVEPFGSLIVQVAKED